MDFCDLTRITVARDKYSSPCSLLFLQSGKLWHLCHALQGHCSVFLLSVVEALLEPCNTQVTCIWPDRVLWRT